jgi:hypothetical protein
VHVTPRYPQSRTWRSYFKLGACPVVYSATPTALVQSTYAYAIPVLRHFTATIEFSACGGSGAGGGRGGSQPVKGTVTITATGSTGNIAQTVPLSVTVN